MPSKRQYDLVQNEDSDPRVPIHPDEAFHHGISFNAKYIGTLDVPRPTSKVEIVAAMRRIRYEFKTKGIKKKKVTLEVSVDGVRVNLRKKKKKNQWMDENKLLVMEHPIYRIFYVSHDSQDLKIFSFIARDGASNIFKCNVFKSTKKSQAMKIVRTVGQAFEVCHKLSSNSPVGLDDEADPLHDLEASSEKDSDAFSNEPRKDIATESLVAEDLDLNLDSPIPASQGRHLHLEMIPPPPSVGHKVSTASAGVGETISSPLSEPLKDNSDVPSAGTPLSAHHEIQLLREQLEQQCQQTQAAVAQVHLLRDQLAAETTARIEAQARTHQLLVHNKELLDHITALVTHLQDQERNLKAEAQGNVAVLPQVYGEQFMDAPEGDFYLGLDNRNSGAFVTAPSSPKARHAAAYYQQPPQHMGSLYSLAYPTPEQQFQAQLLQRLQGVSAGYTPILSPTVYSTLPTYNFCAFPGPFYPKRREDDLRLDPPPAVRRKELDEQQQQQHQQRERSEARESRERRERSREALDEPREARRVSPKPSSSPLNIPSPRSPKSPSPVAVATSSSSPPPPPPPVHSPKTSSSYTNAIASALSSIRTLRVTGGGQDRGRKTPTAGPGPITRSTSEKVPNRSELMDLVQRTAWARQTK